MCITTYLVLSTHPFYEGVGRKEAHVMSTLTSGYATGSSALVGEADSEAQVGSSTQAPKDGRSNSGEFPNILVTLGPNMLERSRQKCTTW